MRKLQSITILVFLIVLFVFAGMKAYNYLFVDHASPVLRADADEISISVKDPESVLLNGMSAYDAKDGDLTDQIIVTGVSQLISADTAKVSYMVFDKAGNAASLTRKVRYVDYELPRFRLTTPLIYPVGEVVTLLDRLTASDVLDGDISGSIRVTVQNLKVDVEGTYSVTVQVSNSLGDTAVLPLSVLISNAYAAQQVIELSDYVVYLEQGQVYDPKMYIRAVKPTSGTTASADDVTVTVSDGFDTGVTGAYQVLFRYHTDQVDYQVYQTVVVR